MQCKTFKYAEKNGYGKLLFHGDRTKELTRTLENQLAALAADKQDPPAAPGKAVLDSSQTYRRCPPLNPFSHGKPSLNLIAFNTNLP